MGPGGHAAGASAAAATHCCYPGWKALRLACCCRPGCSIPIPSSRAQRGMHMVPDVARYQRDQSASVVRLRVALQLPVRARALAQPQPQNHRARQLLLLQVAAPAPVLLQQGLPMYCPARAQLRLAAAVLSVRWPTHGGLCQRAAAPGGRCAHRRLHSAAGPCAAASSRPTCPQHCR